MNHLQNFLAKFNFEIENADNFCTHRFCNSPTESSIPLLYRHILKNRYFQILNIFKVVLNKIKIYNIVNSNFPVILKI